MKTNKRKLVTINDSWVMNSLLLESLEGKLTSSEYPFHLVNKPSVPRVKIQIEDNYSSDPFWKPDSKSWIINPNLGDNYHLNPEIDQFQVKVASWRGYDESESLPESFASFYSTQDDLSLKQPLYIVFFNTLKDKERIDDLEAIDFLYDYIDNLIEKNDFMKINNIIRFFISKEFKLKLSVGLLTITHPYKNTLTNRSSLIEYAISAGKKENLTEEQITSILNGF